jgi:hypothetical protein
MEAKLASSALIFIFACWCSARRSVSCMSTYMRRIRARSVRAESRGIRPESRGSCTRAGAVLPLPVRPRKSCVPSFAQKPTRVGRRLITREGVPFVEVGLQVVLPDPIRLFFHEAQHAPGPDGFPI